MRHAAISVVFLASAMHLLVAPSVGDEPREVLPDTIKVGDQDFTLATPTLNGTESAGLQESALKALVGNARWKFFQRDSVVAPVKIDLAYLKDPAGGRIGHSIHVAFITHTPFETLRDGNLVTELLSANDDSSENSRDDKSVGQPLSSSELAEYDIALDHDSVQYSYVEVPLLKKVRLSGGLVSRRMADDQQVRIGFEMDDRFSVPDKKVFNSWSRMADNAGEDSERPFSGLGGYLTITGLQTPPDACFVEARVLMHEPQDWFNGSNFLRSKLPVMLQELARTFRRRMKRVD